MHPSSTNANYSVFRPRRDLSSLIFVGSRWRSPVRISPTQTTRAGLWAA